MVYVERAGHGPDLVMVHGWGMNGAVFDAVGRELAQHFRVHILDLPGYGLSAEPATTLDGLLDGLLSVLPQRSHLLGWSLGGMLAILLAARHPHRVQSLLTVASSPRFVAEPEWPGTRLEVLSQFATQLARDSHKTVDRFLAIQAMGSPTAREDVRHLRESVLSRPEPHPEALRLGLTLLAELDLRPELRALTVPALHLFGRLDALVPAEVIERWPASQALQQTHLFATSSHAPFMTESNQFVRIVLKFVEAQETISLSSGG